VHLALFCKTTSDRYARRSEQSSPHKTTKPAMSRFFYARG
jgi:hypothetical protein